MQDQNQTSLSPDEWTGVYYDSEAGELVTIEFLDDGRVVLKHVDSDEPMHTFDSRTAFADAATEFMEIPQHAVDDPVSVAVDAYNKGYQHGMDNNLESAIALMYADTQVEIVEKTN